MPKEDQPSGTNQDRAGAASVRGDSGHLELRAAVADGATQSFEPGSWAEALVDAFIRGAIRPTQRTPAILATVAGLHLEQPAATDSWIAQGRAALGSYATLAGVTLSYRRGWRWVGLAIGDSAAFVVDRDGRVKRKFPYQRLDEFPAAPVMLGTTTRNNDVVSQRGLRWTGPLGAHDRIWLTTDEIARWTIAQLGDGADPFTRLDGAVRSHRTFAEFITQLRAGGSVADDDMTILRIRRS